VRGDVEVYPSKIHSELMQGRSVDASLPVRKKATFVRTSPCLALKSVCQWPYKKSDYYLGAYLTTYLHSASYCRSIQAISPTRSEVRTSPCDDVKSERILPIVNKAIFNQTTHALLLMRMRLAEMEERREDSSSSRETMLSCWMREDRQFF
jgi:hypothetical protein